MDPLTKERRSLSRSKHSLSEARAEATKLCLRQFYRLAAILCERTTSDAETRLQRVIRIAFAFAE
jgi:hypothetical protein